MCGRVRIQMATASQQGPRPLIGTSLSVTFEKLTTQMAIFVNDSPLPQIHVLVNQLD